MTDPTRATADRQQEPRDTDESSLARVVEALSQLAVWLETPLSVEVPGGKRRMRSVDLGPGTASMAKAIHQALSLLSPEGGGKEDHTASRVSLPSSEGASDTISPLSSLR